MLQHITVNVQGVRSIAGYTMLDKVFVSINDNFPRVKMQFLQGLISDNNELLEVLRSYIISSTVYRMSSCKKHL